MLSEKDPNLGKLMDISMKKYKDEQMVKDARVLEILKMKDGMIEDLQAKCVK